MSYATSEKAVKEKRKSSLASESFWGLTSTTVQVLSMTLFFVLVAHNYSKPDLAKFMVSNTVYQLIASVSNLGLSGWFVRELARSNSNEVATKFLRLQLLSGVFFYVASSVAAPFLYSDSVIVQLILLLGVNILTDNFIYFVKSLNISQSKQRRSVLLQALDAVSKLMAIVIAVYVHLSIVELVALMILFRVVLLIIYIALGFASEFDFRTVISFTTPLAELKKVVIDNWYFLVLGSISLIYWRISNIIVFNYLSLQDVANFEIAFRLFSIAQMLPVVISSSLLPRLVNLLNQQRFGEANKLMSVAYALSFLYGLFAWTAINSFGIQIIPLVFGKNYIDAYTCARQMALTLLIFPTGILQASLLTAMDLERKDMWFNIISLVACVVLAMLGLQFVETSIWVVNAAIFISFFLFHLCQDTLLINKKFFKQQQTFGSYAIALSLIGVYWWLQSHIGLTSSFTLFWGLLATGVLGTFLFKKPQSWLKLLVQ